MGFYDTFEGYWRCPDCHQSGSIDIQTKELERMLNYYHPGDLVIHNHETPSFTIQLWHQCNEGCSVKKIKRFRLWKMKRDLGWE